MGDKKCRKAVLDIKHPTSSIWQSSVVALADAVLLILPANATFALGGTHKEARWGKYTEGRKWLNGVRLPRGQNLLFWELRITSSKSFVRGEDEVRRLGGY